MPSLCHTYRCCGMDTSNVECGNVRTCRNIIIGLDTTVETWSSGGWHTTLLIHCVCICRGQVLRYWSGMPASQRWWSSPANICTEVVLKVYRSRLLGSILTTYWPLGMLNDNRKIDYWNRFSFSCLYYRFSKWVCVHWQQLARSGC